MSEEPHYLQLAISSTFTGLADALEREPRQTWNLPSLCERWRLRDVVAHMTNAARYEPEQFMAEVGADGGDIGRTIDRLAERDGALEPSALVADLRSERLHRWEPPGGGRRGALTHAVIHCLDVVLPSPITFRPDATALAAALDIVIEDEVFAHFGTSIDGRRLYAADLDRTWGDGEGDGDGDVIEAAASDLLVALCGRALPGASVSLRAGD